MVDAMAKADDKSTPNEAADPRAGDLPLEDPRWIPLSAVHKRLAERLASNRLAAEDLTKAMADGVIRSMQRWADEHELAPPGFPPNRERKLVSSDYWTRQELVYTKTFGLTVQLRDHASPRGGWAVVGRVFFGWKPDIDRFWLRYEPPVDEPKVEQEAEKTSSQGIPGRRLTRDWPIVVATEVLRRQRAGELERPTTASMIAPYAPENRGLWRKAKALCAAKPHPQ
jgi:hypothetical protein